MCITGMSDSKMYHISNTHWKGYSRTVTALELSLWRQQNFSCLNNLLEL